MQQWLIFAFTIIFTFSLWGQPLEPSKNCSECHNKFYAEWQASRHADSDRQPIYKAVFIDQDNPETCYTCHQPVYAIDLEAYVESRIEESSVSCDFCHAVRIDPDNLTYELIPENIKFGTIKDAVASTHQCQYDALYAESEFCKTCHDYTHPALQGSFSSVYQEWKNSRFSQQDVMCQDCHMPANEGKAATLGKIRDQIHSHDFYNGESREFLYKIADLEIRSLRKRENVTVDVSITNTAVGHGLPSGSPLRMVILQIEIRNREQQPIWRNWYKNPLIEDEKAVFGKRFYSADKKLVLPWKKSQQKIDHRLLPDSTITLNYTLRDSNATWIEAKLLYHTLPPPYEEKFVFEQGIEYKPLPIVSRKEKIGIVSE